MLRDAPLVLSAYMLKFTSKAGDLLLRQASSSKGLDSAAFERLVMELRWGEDVRKKLKATLVEYKVSELQLGVLLMLLDSEGGVVPMKSLAGNLLVSKPAVTDAVDALEALNWLERMRSPRDRRTAGVKLTNLGRSKASVVVHDYICALASHRRHNTN